LNFARTIPIGVLRLDGERRGEHDSQPSDENATIHSMI